METTSSPRPRHDVEVVTASFLRQSASGLIAAISYSYAPTDSVPVPEQLPCAIMAGSGALATCTTAVCHHRSGIRASGLPRRLPPFTSACVAGCGSETLVLRAIFGSYVQTQGPSHGVLWDPETLQPLVDTPAMDAALAVSRW